MKKTVITIVFLSILGSLAVTGCGTATKNHSSNGTKESTVSVYELRASSNEWFSSIIKSAMTYVTKTKFVLLAPTLPDYSPHDGNWYTDAIVQSSANNYSVNLQWAYRQLPINSPELSNWQYANIGDAGIIGSFGGTQYPSDKAAEAQLYVTQIHDVAPAYQSPPAKSKGVKVDLGHGIHGLAYSSSVNSMVVSMVVWHQEEWTLEVTGMAPLPIQETKEIITYLHTHKLPSTNGVFIVEMAGDGNHTSAQWEFGKVVYSCSDYHSALQAAKMAVSMRVYPSRSGRL